MAIQYATASQLNSWTDETVADDRADFILELISGAVAEEAGPASATWTADTVPATVKVVVLRAATRVATNPTDEQLEALGGYSHTAGVAGLMLTDEERATCRKAGGLGDGTRARAGSSRMVRSC